MKYKVAMIPMISPLYRFPVWEKMSLLNKLDITFFLEVNNNHTDIKFIPTETLNKTFNWKLIKTVYLRNEFYWQKRIFTLAFSNYNALIFSGNPRGISTWITTIIARLLGKKVFFWTHGMYGKESKLQLCIKKVFFSLPNAIFLYGNYAKEKLELNNINPKKLKLVYNSLDYDFHKKMRKQKKVTGSCKQFFKKELPVLLFIGRLTAQKKLHQLFEAVEKTEEFNNQYNILIIGDGSEKQKLQQISKNIQSETYFYGGCYDENILSDLVYEADLCISPGNVGLTVIHCFSYGTPVITHSDFKYQMPEAEAITPGLNGDFFNLDDTTDLANKITSWFEKMKTTNREEIRLNCYKVIDDKYNPYYQASLIEDTLIANKY